jgi:shikimate kinase
MAFEELVNDDYYSYAPTLVLERPLVLIGMPGCGAGTVASLLSQRTGIPLVELERWIEHEAGCSLAQLVLERGEAELRRREEVLLPRALAEVPVPVVALGDGALRSRASRKRVKRHATLVYLRLQRDSLVGRAQLATRELPSAAWHTTGHEPDDDDAVHFLRMLDEREKGYGGADLVLDVDDRSTLQVSKDLLERLRSGALA